MSPHGRGEPHHFRLQAYGERLFHAVLHAVLQRKYIGGSGVAVAVHYNKGLRGP